MTNTTRWDRCNDFLTKNLDYNEIDAIARGEPWPVDELHSFVLDEIILATQRLEKIKPQEGHHAERSKI